MILDNWIFFQNLWVPDCFCFYFFPLCIHYNKLLRSHSVKVVVNKFLRSYLFLMTNLPRSHFVPCEQTPQIPLCSLWTNSPDPILITKLNYLNSLYWVPSIITTEISPLFSCVSNLTKIKWICTFKVSWMWHRHQSQHMARFVTYNLLHRWIQLWDTSS